MSAHMTLNVEYRKEATKKTKQGKLSEGYCFPYFKKDVIIINNRYDYKDGDIMGTIDNHDCDINVKELEKLIK